MESLLKIKDVAKLLNVSERSVRTYIYDKGLPHINLVGQYRFEKDKVLEWARNPKKELKGGGQNK